MDADARWASAAWSAIIFEAVGAATWRPSGIGSRARLRARYDCGESNGHGRGHRIIRRRDVAKQVFERFHSERSNRSSNVGRIGLKDRYRIQVKGLRNVFRLILDPRRHLAKVGVVGFEAGEHADPEFAVREGKPGKCLRQVVRGFMNYHAVPTNFGRSIVSGTPCSGSGDAHSEGAASRTPRAGVR